MEQRQNGWYWLTTKSGQQQPAMSVAGEWMVRSPENIAEIGPKIPSAEELKALQTCPGDGCPGCPGCHSNSKNTELAKTSAIEYVSLLEFEATKGKGKPWISEAAAHLRILTTQVKALQASLDQVDEVLLVNWVGPRKDGDYRQALHDLVTSAIREHNDPRVSKEAAEREAQMKALEAVRNLLREVTDRYVPQPCGNEDCPECAYFWDIKKRTDAAIQQPQTKEGKP